MNWNLISKNKSGELEVNFLWVSFLIVFLGFLFGLGFYFSKCIIGYIFDNDGYYIYHFIKEYKIGIFLVLLLFFVSKIKREV